MIMRKSRPDTHHPPWAVAAFLGSTLVLVTPVLGNEPTTEPSNETTITVTFDPGATEAIRRASGFLSLINANTPDPPTSLVRALAPQLWKNAYHTNYDRITTQFDCPTVITTLAEHWGLPATSPPPWIDDSAPSWASWEAFCRHHVDTHLDQGFNPVWNVWNEPDGSSRWWHGPSGYNNLAETYLRIRQAYIDHPGFDLADLVIAAPGFADWGNAYGFHSGFDYWTSEPFEVGFDGFLQFCTNHDLECHVIMWHEFWEDYVFYIPTKAQILKNLVDTHQLAHPEVNVQRYYIDEMIHASWPFAMDYHLSPGHVAAVLSLVEMADVDGAVRACWGDRYGFSGNINFSVDSVLDVQYCENPPGNPVLTPAPSYCHANPYAPRSQYWVHWYYARFEGPVATVESDYPPQAGFATHDSTNGIYQLLLGYSLAYGFSGGVPTYDYGTTRTTVELGGLPRVHGNRPGRARLTVREIPPSGLDPLAAPPVLVDRRRVFWLGDSFAWVLPEVKRGHAYVLELTDLEPAPTPLTPK